MALCPCQSVTILAVSIVLSIGLDTIKGLFELARISSQVLLLTFGIELTEEVP